MFILPVNLILFLICARQAYLSPFTLSKKKDEMSRLRWLDVLFAMVNILFSFLDLRLRLDGEDNDGILLLPFPLSNKKKQKKSTYILHISFNMRGIAGHNIRNRTTYISHENHSNRLRNDKSIPKVPGMHLIFMEINLFSLYRRHRNRVYLNHNI